MKNKAALVTGSSTGLGYATALALAEEGALVAINSRSLDNLVKAKEKIRSATGNEPAIIDGDISQKGAAEEIARKAIKLLGKIDILVSNAGGPPAGKFLDLEKEAWIKAVDLTLHSAINLTRAVVPGMIERKWGRIIYITSLAVKQPIDNLLISNTLRAGLTGFAKSISNDLAKHGLTINTVAPGYTETERLVHLAEVESKASGKAVQDIYAGWAANVPAGRLGKPEELAA
ncbi:MAG: SDR family NAD(P)-dependent oxidoreductase, partial [Candidatus Zixiibacteriota bacterium]